MDANQTAALFSALLLAGCSTGRVTPLGNDPDVSPPESGEAVPPPETTPPPPVVAKGYTRAAPAAPGAIAAENAKPGERLDLAKPARPDELAAFAFADSVEAGEAVEVAVHASQATTVAWDLFRVGWYGGAGARKLASGAGVAAGPQQRCDVEPTTMRVDCAWPVAFRVTLDPAWLSGLYALRLTRADGLQAYVPFAVRDHRKADLALLWNATTDEAYNGWQGESLYQDDSRTMPEGKANAVSFNRPLASGFGAGLMLAQQAPMARFLERLGYDVTYGTGLDAGLRPGFLDGVRALALAGHDEYWTQLERDEVSRLLARGGGLLNFGANTGFWRVRFEPDAAGRLRWMVCYKAEQGREPAGYGATARFRDVGQPEHALFGNGYAGWVTTFFPLVAADAEGWLFAGTGMAAGEAIHGVGYNELDRVYPDAASPAGLETLARIPAFVSDGSASAGHAVSYTTPSGGFVFSAGAIYWPVMLGQSSSWNDARVERMTFNVLERALGTGKAPPPLGARPAPSVRAKWADAVATVAGAARGYQDGPAASARFDGPTALALAPSGRLFVADTNNHRLRALDPASGFQVSTVAGTGEAGAADGDAAQATFRAPQGLAFGADGALYVADTGNALIRRVRFGATVTVETVAGVAGKTGRTDGPALQARFNSPRGLAFDDDGRLLVADTLSCAIRRLDLAKGVVDTVVGNGCGNSDGPLTTAMLRYPTALATSPSGNTYVVDAGNQRLVRLTFTDLTTIAGGGNGYADGTGAVARLRPYGAIVPAHGLVFFADSGNARLRKLVAGLDAPSTEVYTVAFDGRVTTADGPASQAAVELPAGAAMSAEDVLYVSDASGNRIRAVTFPPTFFQ